ncbi:MAG: hypothetical protein IKC65_03655, partial [Lentisphaeria bacterium]|nr:hypothetical protein [Lentisphaeria bacterium]
MKTQNDRIFHFNPAACTVPSQDTPLFLKEKGGALKTDKNGQKRTKTDIGAPQNTAGFAQQQNTPLFLKEKGSA